MAHSASSSHAALMVNTREENRPKRLSFSVQMRSSIRAWVR
jgi:hypothetical protein